MLSAGYRECKCACCQKYRHHGFYIKNSDHDISNEKLNLGERCICGKRVCICSECRICMELKNTKNRNCDCKIL